MDVVRNKKEKIDAMCIRKKIDLTAAKNMGLDSAAYIMTLLW